MRLVMMRTNTRLTTMRANATDGDNSHHRVCRRGCRCSHARGHGTQDVLIEARPVHLPGLGVVGRGDRKLRHALQRHLRRGEVHLELIHIRLLRAKQGLRDCGQAAIVIVGGSDGIQQYLEDQGNDLHKGLSEIDKANSHAFIRMAEEHMYFHLML